MARSIGRLTALKVEKAKRPGMYADGGGLYTCFSSARRTHRAQESQKKAGCFPAARNGGDDQSGQLQPEPAADEFL